MKMYLKSSTSLMLAFMLVGTMFAGLSVTTDIITDNASAAGGSFGGGDGTAGNPYPVEDVLDLQNMSTNLSAHYVLGNDIDASGTYSWANGFIPIGNGSAPFEGSFDGKGFVISDFYINRQSTDDVGLFGVLNTSAVVKNVTLLDVDITGDTRCGALVGWNLGRISNSSSYGSVSGSKTVGGLVGNNAGDIDNSTSYCSVTNIGLNTGGLIGFMGEGTVMNSYSTGLVSGDERVGGFVGRYFGAGSHIENCYSSGLVTGNLELGGFSGNGVGEAVNSFYDNQTSGQTSSNTGTGYNTADMMTESTFSNAGWDMANTWWMEDGWTRPFLRVQHSYAIHTGAQLQLIELDLNGNYTIDRDVDMSDIKDPSYMWGTSRDAGKGFSPIAEFIGVDRFKGTLDGRNNTLSQLYINAPTKSGVGLFEDIESSTLKNIRFSDFNITGRSYTGGLFACVDDETVATYIANCHGENITIISPNEVYCQDVGVLGGGMGGGNIFNCSVSASTILVNAEDTSNIGGLISRALFRSWTDRVFIRNSSADVDIYAPGSATSTRNIGGFIGSVGTIPLTIENCSSSGRVYGSIDTGGFMGDLSYNTNITNCHSSSEVFGLKNVGGFVGYMNEHWDYNTTVKNCSASGLVRGDENTGGFAGIMYGTGDVNRIIIENCSSTSPVTDSILNTGGFIGYIDGGNPKMNNIFRSGHVVPGENSGTFIGNNNADNINISSSYYNNETSSLPSAVGLGTDIPVQGLNTADMLKQSSYPGWDFTETWGIVEGEAFPYLRSCFPQVPRQFNGYISDQNNSTVGPMEVLLSVVEGERVGKIYTGDDGYYYQAYSNDLYEEGDILMLYGSVNSGGHNNTIVKTADEGLYHHDIRLDESVYLYDAMGVDGISVSEIIDAPDTLNRSDILYDELAGGIELDYGASLISEKTTKLLLDGNITSEGGAEILFGDSVEAYGDVRVFAPDIIFKGTIAGTGGITVDGDAELYDDTSTPYQTFIGPVDIKNSVSMNGTSIRFNQDVEGADLLSIGANLTVDSNITTVGQQTYGGRVSFTGSYSTLNAPTVVFEKGVVNEYGALTINGRCELHEDVETLTGQVYNGDVVLGNSIYMTTTGNGDLIFNGSLESYGTPMDLNIQTGTGDIKFMGNTSIGRLRIADTGGIINNGHLSSETLTVQNCRGTIEMGTFVIDGPTEIRAEVLQGEIITGSLTLDVPNADMTGEINGLSGEAGAEEIELLDYILMNRVFFDGIDLYSFGPDDKIQAVQDEYYYNVYDAKYPAGESVTWSMDTNASSWISMDSGLLSGTPGNDDVGAYWVEVTVADEYGNQTSRNFTLTVLNVNDPPEISSDNVLEAVEGVNYSVEYEAVDIDSDELSWAVDTNAAWLDMSSDGLLEGNPEPGVFYVNINVNDNNGGSDWSNFTLTVYEDSNGNGIPDYKDPEMFATTEYVNETVWNNETIIEYVNTTTPEYHNNTDWNNETVTVTESQTPTWAWGAVIAAIALGALVAILILKNPPKKKEQEFEESEEDVEPEEAKLSISSTRHD